MLKTATVDASARAALATRLKSIEGQARGIQRMLEDDRDCQAIFEQLTALRAAAHAVAMEALVVFGRSCLKTSGDPPDEVLQYLVGVVSKLTR
ncbi:MAG TPA: metal-sensitive transcriptional regulator [Ktedonobacterales bacterium]